MNAQSGPATWLKRVVLALVLGLGCLAIYRTSDELEEGLRQLSPWVFAAAFVPVVLGMLVGLEVWRTLMGALGSPLPRRAAAGIFFISQLGKYVPGSVWSVLGQMELGREHEVPRRTSASVGVLVLVISVTAGASIAVLLLPFAGLETVLRYWWVLPVVPLCYLVLHPPVLSRLLDLAFRLVRMRPDLQLPTWPALRKALLLQACVWLLLGCSVWLLLLGLGAPAGESLVLAVGGYALGYGLGMMAVGLPAGAGVREAALVIALSGVVTAPQALLVALLSRFISTVCDVGMALVHLRLRRRSRTTPEEPRRSGPPVVPD